MGEVERRRRLEPLALPQRLRLAPPSLSQGIATSADLISTITSSLPILVFVGIAIWYARSAGLKARAPSGVTMLELYEQQVAETKRMNATLEGIAGIMEKRPQG